MYGVIKFQAPFERLKEYNYSPEVRLYKAILTQAIIDLSNVADNKEARRLELEAKKWIFGNSHDFQEICHNAEMSPGFVIKIAKDAIKLNLAKKHDVSFINNKTRQDKFKVRKKRKFVA